jgi:glucokinase
VAEPLVIGVDVGGTKLLAGAVDREGVVARRREVPTVLTSQDELLAALDGLVESMLGDDVAALGFGLPSMIDQRSGTAVNSVNIPLAGVRFRDRMRERFDLPVGVENDANAATLAEWQIGAARGADHVVMLTLGTGIGGGLVLDGRLYRGSIGAGAELGHMVLDYDGPPCGQGCNGHGHFEVLASGPAADALARERFGPESGARDLGRRSEAGDEEAAEILALVGRRLGAGLASLVNVFNPELIVLGGGFAEVGEPLLRPARELVEQEALPPARDLVRIVPAELGPDAGLLGAALVGFQALDGAQELPTR